MTDTFLNIRDLEAILRVWKGKHDHRDAGQVEQAIETMEKLESLLEHKKKEFIK